MQVLTQPSHTHSAVGELSSPFPPLRWSATYCNLFTELCMCDIQLKFNSSWTSPDTAVAPSYVSFYCHLVPETFNVSLLLSSHPQHRSFPRCLHSFRMSVSSFLDVRKVNVAFRNDNNNTKRKKPYLTKWTFAPDKSESVCRMQVGKQDANCRQRWAWHLMGAIHLSGGCCGVMAFAFTLRTITLR